MTDRPATTVGATGASLAREERDAGNDPAPDRDVGVRSERPRLETFLLVEQRVNPVHRERAELRVDGDVPRLAVQARCGDEPRKVGAEGSGSGDRRDRERGDPDHASRRHRGAGTARVDGIADPDCRIRR